jgi:hypothetical protein
LISALVEGRQVDIQGQPAAGVVVRVAMLNFKHEIRPYDAKGVPSLWPSPATTDADGRFRVLGLGADAPATYEVEDPRYAHQAFSFQAWAQGEGTPRPAMATPAPRRTRPRARRPLTSELQRARRSGVDVCRARRINLSYLTIRCASYPEWLRDGPDDATATGSPILVNAGANSRPAMVSPACTTAFEPFTCR